MQRDDATTTLPGSGSTVEDDGAIPKLVGRYEIVEPLGAGGMGIVFVARDPELDRKVALKLVRPRLRPGRDEDDSAKRLLREARAMATLSHENVVPVFDAGEDGRRVYIAMELVDGGTLDAWMREHPDATWEQIVDMYIAAARGLAAAHAAGIIHRDFKPSNVLVGDDGRVRVLDFGLAKWGAVPSSAPDAGEVDVAAGLEMELTRAGSVMGTLGYIPPEQLKHGVADARSDQFSFCASLFKALFGHHPFRPLSSTDYAVFDKPPNVPAEHGRPRWLVDVVLRGLSVDPDERFDGMEDVVAVLERRRGRWRLPLILAGVGVLGAAAIAAFALGGKPPAGCEDPQIGDAWRPEIQERVAAQAGGDAAVRALSEYAERWVAAQVRTCATAKQLKGLDFDRRMRCLSRARTSLRALSEAIVDSPDAVMRAPVLAGELPRPEACEDDLSLARLLAPPADAELATTVIGLRDRLAAVDSLTSTGRTEAALKLARTVAEEASIVEYAPLRAEALLSLGLAQDNAGDYEQALATLDDAYVRAKEASHDHVAARAAIKLLYVVGYRLGRHDEADRWAGEAAAALERFGADPQLEARLESNLGAVDESAGRYESAKAHFERALEIRVEAFGRDSLAAALSLSNLGAVLHQLGDADGAEARLRQSLEIFERELGLQHPELCRRLNSLGRVLEERDDLDAAHALYTRALDLAIAAHGEAHPEVADYLNALAGLARRQQQWPQARSLLERGLAVLEKTVGPNHPKVAGQLTNLGHVLSGAGDHAHAVEFYSRALAIIEEAWRPDHPRLIMPLRGMGQAYLLLRDVDHARPVLKRALDLAQKHGGPVHKLQFELAVATWPVDPTAAKALAAEARTSDDAEMRSAIDAWLEGNEKRSELGPTPQ